MKVCLVFPRMKYVSGDPPLGLAYIASYLRQNTNAEVHIVDATFHPSHDWVNSELRRLQPDILGVYVDSIMYNDAVRIMKNARIICTPYIIAGGPHATVCPETLAPFAAVIRGEGERILAAIVTHLSENFTGIISSIVRGAVIEDLDTLPFPALDLVDLKQYMQNWHYLEGAAPGLLGTTMITSRGCPFDCAYCQPTLREIFGKKVRRRSPQNVVEEIDKLVRHHGVQGIFFQDDTFTYDDKWLEEFCALMVSRTVKWGCNTRADTINDSKLKLMKAAGCLSLHIGIEAHSDRIRNTIYKKRITLSAVERAVVLANYYGIQMCGFFMLGAPTETRQEIGDTIAYSRTLGLTEASYSIFSPLPHTHMYEMMKDVYNISDDFKDYDYYASSAFQGELSFKELKRLRITALLRFYLRPCEIQYIMSHFSNRRSFRRMLNIVKRFT